MPFRIKKKGFTLPELMTAMLIFALIIGGTGAMVVSTIHCYDGQMAKVATDAGAVKAISLMVNDVREANVVDPLPVTLYTDENGDKYGTMLRITLPTKVAGKDYYDRHNPDTSHQIDYYLSDSSGAVGSTGTSLWRYQAGVDRKRIIESQVSDLRFYPGETTRSVKITIITKAKMADKVYGRTVDDPNTQQTKLSQRVIYLRNWD